MNKRFNIIQLTGIKGIFLILFIIGCAIAGFLVFPGWVCMHVWNYISSYFVDMPSMTILHGIILWCIIALVTYQLNKKDIGISFKSVPSHEERLKTIIEAKKRREAQLKISEIPEIADKEKEEIKK